MDRLDLLNESTLDKFLRYVQVDTESDPGGTTVPTTAGQWKLLWMLRNELESMGLGEIDLSDHGILTATLPGTAGTTTVGLIAHVDTSPAVSGHNVQPVVHRHYDGGKITLPSGIVLEPEQHPGLALATGSDIVTSDGTTLLGADDKAGVSEIMGALAWLLSHPGVPHVRLRVAFTPDEETGRGVEYLDVSRFGADVAYTLDGSALGELSAENFHAENLRVSIRGRSAHTGSARGQMVNAVHLASRLIGSVPETMRPETTDGRQGFIHFDHVDGGPELVHMLVLLRDFEVAGLDAKRSWLRQSLQALEAGYPGCQTSVERVGGYRNMAEAIGAHPEVVQRAVQAMEACGIEVRMEPIRGGTDGARLTERGLPTPNLFAGGMEFHSRTEWIPVTWMDQARETIIRLAQVWAE